MTNKILLGFFFLNLLAGSTGMWGFLSVYLRNYYYYNSKKILQNFDSIIIFHSLSMWVGNILAPYFLKKIKSSYLYFFAISIKCLCYLFYLKANNIFETFLSAFFIGMSEQTIIALNVFFIVGLFKGKKGIKLGIVQSAVSLKTLIWSNLMVHLVNPKNLKPDNNNIFDKTLAENFGFYIWTYAVCNFFFGLIGMYFLGDLNKILEKNEKKEEVLIELENRNNKNLEKKITKDKEEKKINPEKNLIKTFILTEKFLIIYITAIIRFGFYIYSSSNFKFIGLTYIKNDFFVSLTNSYLYILDGISRIITGKLLDTIKIKTFIFYIYILYIFVIIFWVFFSQSYFFYILSIFVIRFYGGSNTIINKFTLYRYYDKNVGFLLMRYFCSFYFLGTFFFVVLDKFVRGEVYYYKGILVVDFFIVFFGIFVLYKDNYKNV